MSKRAGVRRYGFIVALAVAVVTGVLTLGGTAYAAACTTTPTTDAALMSAVAAGSPGDVICLNANQQYSPTAPLEVKRNLTIETDPAQLAIAGNRAGIISGSAVVGGSTALDPFQNDVLVVNTGVTLTLHQIVETQTVQPSNGGVVVLSGGTLFIDHSLLSGNTGNAVNIKAGGTGTITNSTLTNSINGFDGLLLGGTATLNQDTIAGNAGDGIDKTAAASASVTNTILANNTLANCNSSAGLTGSHSGDTGTSCGATITTGGFSNVSAGIAASPANNGGPTNTLALTAASPAIGAGTGAGGGADDQRGFLRDASPDIGAYEFGATAPATLTVIKHVVGPGSASSFQITVTGGGANPATFPGADTPGTQVTIASGAAYSINETGPAGYTASASGNCASPPAGPPLPATGTAGAAGTNVTCTITNTAVGFNLLVTKTVDNTGCASNCATPADFTMTVMDTTANQQLGQFPGSVAGTSVQVPAGHAYNVTEQADAAQTGKYTPSTTGPCSGTATVNGGGTCAFTNSFLTCPQPANSGPQPAPGAPGSSSNTCVNANVAATIQVTSPASISFPALAVGQTSGLVGVPVTVFSNDPTGYQLTVKRTAFYSPTDIPLAISCPAVAAPQAFLAPFTGASAQIPVGSSLNLGTSNQITTVSGDSWPFQFQLGPIPFGIPAGAHQSVVTFTAVGL